MHICHINIENFRNFKRLEVDLSHQAVIVGENKVGKTNLLFALRLVLDPTLSDVQRELRKEDFWDGLTRPMEEGHVIRIDVDLAGFDKDDSIVAILADHLVAAEPLIARLSYEFRPKPTPPGSDGIAYEFGVFGGNRPDNPIGFEVRKHLPLKVLHALRDAETDLANWRNSPLRPLIENLESQVDTANLNSVATRIDKAAKRVTALSQVTKLSNRITKKMTNMVGTHQAVETRLGLLPTNPDKLLRSLKLYIDGDVGRTVTEASLGTANLLYVSLLDLEIQLYTQERRRLHTFLGIEEPEAHLHPQLQRLVYKAFLRERNAIETTTSSRCMLLTTHSPHIVSVTPVRSLVLLKASEQNGTTACSTVGLDFTEAEVADVERYLDVTRGEILFAKGVVLVEGIAEAILIPTLAKSSGIKLDEEGISVCSINGTHFGAYIRFLDALGIPWAVITDGDPIARETGVRRAARLQYRHETGQDKMPENADVDGLAARARIRGVFVGDHTLEVDLFKAGLGKHIKSVLAELDEGWAITARAQNWNTRSLHGENAKRYIEDIENISKGRFAQRLSQKPLGRKCPNYIIEALQYVRNGIKRELQHTVPAAAQRAAGEPEPAQVT